MWRHRKVSFSSDFNIRPSPDRVRETLFNWLQGDIAGRRCLEPFAGSGILSFEALSRGAALVTLSETVPGVVSSLKAEADKLGALAPACDIRLADGYALLKAPPPLTDLVFLDPPFAEARFDELFEALSEKSDIQPTFWFTLKVLLHCPNRALPHSASSRLNKNKLVE